MAPLKRDGPGRPPVARLSRLRRIVTKMAEHGITQAEAADIIGVSETTLKRRLGDEFKAGVVHYDGAVVKNLRRIALGNGPGAVTAAIYWTKVRLGWSEKLRLEVSFGPVIEKLTSGLLDVLHRAVPDFCPGCNTALDLKPKVAKMLLEESQKLVHAEAGAATEAVAHVAQEPGA